MNPKADGKQPLSPSCPRTLLTRSPIVAWGLNSHRNTSPSCHWPILRTKITPLSRYKRNLGRARKARYPVRIRAPPPRVWAGTGVSAVSAISAATLYATVMSKLPMGRYAGALCAALITSSR